jgi:hypothetical protein
MLGYAVLLALSLLAPGDPTGVSELEREAGWVDLFDGKSLTGWHTFGGEGVRPGGWEVVEGCLHLPTGASGGDLVTDRDYAAFELELEWKIAPGANSGIKYRVPETADATAMLGPEYQVLDDAANAEGTGATSAAALYALYEPSGKQLEPAGTFNHTRIVARGERLEHWLNGVRVLECDVGSEDWESRRKASKFAPHADFARGRGRIGLQDHGGEVWYRNIRVRDLENLPGEPVELFDGKSLAGWKALGDARYSVDDGCILGEVGAGGHSFLVSERTFGDFLLEVEVKTELPGNSGIQIRSHLGNDQRVIGYQVEIDPTDRRWSGGIYDEGRRGQFLDDKLAGGRAFVPGEWNHYRIECLGPWIRTWINGVPAADVLDPLDLEGFIGLQVHSGHDTRVRWRNLRLKDLGTRQWEQLSPEELAEAWTVTEGQPAVRCSLALRPESLGYRVHLRTCEPKWSTPYDLPNLAVSVLDLNVGWVTTTSGVFTQIWNEEGTGSRSLEALVHKGRLSITSKGLGLSAGLNDGNASYGARVRLSYGGNLEFESIERVGPPKR